MLGATSAALLQVEKEVLPYMETEWECMECGYLHEGKAAPRRCPDCGASGAWEKVEYVDGWDDDDLDDEKDLDEDEHRD
jgi:rubredoxin